MAIIAISRGTLAGGQALAQCVAGRLGYPCIGREAILDAATWYGVPEEMLAASTGKEPSNWDRLNVERRAYVNAFQSALSEHAKRGNLVYHGHAGHLMLPGIPGILRVRVIADVESRIEAVMRERRLSREDAVVYIEQVDGERRDWVSFLYGVDLDDSSLFDVVLNLSRMSDESVCSTVVHMARLDEFRQTAQSLKAIEDLAISSRILAILARDPRTVGAVLDVAAHDGIVTITGTTHKGVADALPSLVAQVEGIKNVRYEMVVGP